jgi:hypothetical protein
MQLKFSDNELYFDIDILENFSFFYNDSPESTEDQRSIYWGNLSSENQDKLLKYEQELKSLLLPKLQELKEITQLIK